MSRHRRNSSRNNHNNVGFFDEIIGSILDLFGQLLNKIIGIVTLIIFFFVLMGILNYKLILEWLNSHGVIIVSCFVIFILLVTAILYFLDKLKTSSRR